MEISNLPRLLYISDVPVESTVAGSALIYRLLQNYPVDRLQIVEGNIWNSNPEKRLSNVAYQTLNIGSKRLLYSRFSSLYAIHLYLKAQRRSPQLTRIINQFQPEAILTVAHGFSWLTAAALAEDFQLPLHLIVHDDWPTINHLPQAWQKSADQKFGDVYRKAKSRLCVSPYMMECYEQRYGVTGDILYPSRAADVPKFDQPPDQDNTQNTSLVFAYAGSINLPGYAQALVSLASVLETLGCNLIIYSALTPESIARNGLNKSNVSVCSLIPYKKLIHTLREEADVLFVPMTFEPKWKPHMQLSFPSKLTDYTATGLPLLIWGPPYCSAVRWAKDHLGLAEVVDEQDANKFAYSVKKLVQEPEYRFHLANNALTQGNQYFAHQQITQKFYKSIT